MGIDGRDREDDGDVFERERRRLDKARFHEETMTE